MFEFTIYYVITFTFALYQFYLDDRNTNMKRWGFGYSLFLSALLCIGLAPLILLYKTGTHLDKLWNKK